MSANKQVVISPIITEKTMKTAEAGKYGFIVSKSSSKTAIKQAVKTMFNVNPVDVQTSILKGRQKRVGSRRVEIVMHGWKKALVELKKGEKISLFEPGGGEAVEEKKEKKEKKNK